MTSVFCCGSVQTYRPQRLQHQQKFDTFITWATFPRASSQAVGDETKFTNDHPSFAVQHVQQVNFGPLESKRYFIPAQGNSGDFIEVAEADLIQANFQKLNSYVIKHSLPIRINRLTILLIGIRIGSVRFIISSSRQTYTKKTQRTSTTGARTLPAHLTRLTCKSSYPSSHY